LAFIKSFAGTTARSMLALLAWLKLKFSSRPLLLILTYHRTLPAGDPQRNEEQPGMITSPRNLKRHIEMLSRIGAVPVDLDEWLDKSHRGAPLPKLAFAITFDDGWQDNYQYAFPLLKSYNIPFTIFLVSRLIGSNDSFWPEQVLYILRSGGFSRRDEALDWLDPFLPDPTSPDPRLMLSLDEADKVINGLKTLDDSYILERLATFYRGNPDAKRFSDTRSILNSAEVEDMAASGLVRYGAHTRHHFRLDRLKNRKALEEEIVGSLEDIKNLCNQSVEIFCYPNGDTSEDALDIVSKHFDGACTTKTGWNHSGCNPHQLKRFNLHDGNSSSDFRVFATFGRGLL